MIYLDIRKDAGALAEVAARAVDKVLQKWNKQYKDNADFYQVKISLELFLMDSKYTDIINSCLVSDRINWNIPDREADKKKPGL